MASTFSSLKIELIGTGEQSGTWGATTNVNLGTAIEQAITGSANVVFASADITLTLVDSNAAQTARALRLNLGGTSGGPRNLIVPAITKQYIVNNTTADTVTIINSTGTGVAVPSGKTMVVFNDGSDVVNVTNYAPSMTIGSLTLTSPIGVPSGGTGISSGTSGGIPYFSGATTIASSAALAANDLVIGGGAGVAPSTTTTGSGVLTALGINVGSSGAFVTNNVANTFIGAQAVRHAATQDGVVLAGRAGGTSSYASVITPDVLTASRAVTLPDEDFTVGFRDIPPVGAKTASYTLALSDIGKYVEVGTGGSIVIPDAVFANGDAISIFNNTSGNITITCNITTAYVAGVNGDISSATLVTRGIATVLFISGTVCVIAGNLS
jgi:hypothetical protein